MNETETRSITLTEFQWRCVEMFVEGFECQDTAELLARVGDGRYGLVAAENVLEGERWWFIPVPDWLGGLVNRWYGLPPGSTEPYVDKDETRQITLTPAQWATLDSLATAHNQPDVQQLLIGFSRAEYTITGRAAV